MKALSEAEWHIMESLWEESPKVGSRIVADMGGADRMEQEYHPDNAEKDERKGPDCL